MKKRISCFFGSKTNDSNFKSLSLRTQLLDLWAWRIKRNNNVMPFNEIDLKLWCEIYFNFEVADRRIDQFLRFRVISYHSNLDQNRDLSVTFFEPRFFGYFFSNKTERSQSVLHNSARSEGTRKGRAAYLPRGTSENPNKCDWSIK